MTVRMAFTGRLPLCKLCHVFSVDLSIFLFLWQYLDLRDMIEPAMPDWDMSIYFPEVRIQNQFGFSSGSSYEQRDQEANYVGKEV